MTTRTIKIGICGLGTVGQGVIALLSEGAEVLNKRVGGTIELVHVATRTPKPEVDTLVRRIPAMSLRSRATPVLRC